MPSRLSENSYPPIWRGLGSALHSWELFEDCLGSPDQPHVHLPSTLSPEALPTAGCMQTVSLGSPAVSTLLVGWLVDFVKQSGQRRSPGLAKRFLSRP